MEKDAGGNQRKILLHLIYVYLYFFLMQVNANIVQEAAELPTKQCCLLASGSIEKVQEVFLCLENQVLMRIEKTTQAVAAIFAAFFVFNVNYTAGTYALFQFLEFLFLKTKLVKKPRLTRLIARLKL